MSKEINRCSCRTVQSTRKKQKNSHGYKAGWKWRKIIFKSAFHVLEALHLLLGIVQYVCGIVKK